MFREYIIIKRGVEIDGDTLPEIITAQKTKTGYKRIFNLREFQSTGMTCTIEEKFKEEDDHIEEIRGPGIVGFNIIFKHSNI